MKTLPNQTASESAIDKRDYTSAILSKPTNERDSNVSFSVATGSVVANDFDDLPVEMRSAKRWLLYKNEPNQDSNKKPRKVPYYTTGIKRHGALDTPADQEKLASFEETLLVFDTGGYAGLGFALGLDGETGSCWQGIDIDGISDHPELSDVVSDLPGYTEKSPSGNGMHAIGYGRKFETLGSNATGIEAYSSGRFFTVTADCSGIHPPTCLAAFVENRLASMHRSKAKSTETYDDSICESITSAQITDLRSALFHLRADDRELWVQIGHALKGLGNVGRGLFMVWSSQSDKFDLKDAASKWKSFKPTKTSYKAIFKIAQEAGWLNPASNAAQSGSSGYLSQGDVDRNEDQGEPSFVRVSLNDVLTNPPEPQRYIWGERLPFDALSLLAAHGGMGKSLMAMQLAAHTATGRPFLALPTEKINTLFFSAEDSTDAIRRRFAAICKADGLDPEEVDRNLIVLDATAAPCLFHEESHEGVRTGKPTAHYHELKALIEAEGVGFLIVDNASDSFGANPIDRQAVTKFIRALVRLVHDVGGAVLLLSHVNKVTSRNGPKQTNDEGYADSAAWHNAARSRLFLNNNDKGGLTLAHNKNNYGKKQPVLNLAFREDGSSLYAVDSAQAGEFDGTDPAAILLAGLARVPLLQLIHEFYIRNESISPSPNSHQTNAHTMLRLENHYPFPREKRGKAECFACLRELQREGYLQVETYSTRQRHLADRWQLTNEGYEHIGQPIPTTVDIPPPIPVECKTPKLVKRRGRVSKSIRASGVNATSKSAKLKIPGPVKKRGAKK